MLTRGDSTGAPLRPNVGICYRLVGDASDVLQSYIRAKSARDLDALVSCWHPDVEVVHPMRPDRSWRGLTTYRQIWAKRWEGSGEARYDIISSDVVGDRIYLQTRAEMADGTVVPCMNIFEVEDGKIRRAWVYTDRVVRDGVDIDGFAREVHPGQ